VTCINKQRFLTELSKFLTFLSDSEREQVLQKFGEIFDAAPSEDELLAALVSPLKVTVELSRAYGKGGIQQALERAVEMSGVDLSAASVPEPVIEAESATEETPSAPAAEDEAVSEAEADAKAPVSADQAEQPGAAAPSQSAFDESVFPPDAPPSAETAPKEDDIYDSIGSAVEAAFESGPSAEPAAPAKAPASMPANTEINFADHAADSPAPAAKAPSDNFISVPVQGITASDTDDTGSEDFQDTEPEEYFDKPEPAKPEKSRSRGKLRPLMLVLFLIIFVPLGLAGIAVLLAVTAVILAAAVSAGGSGVFAVSLAFSGMALFSDIIMTIGMALVCFAFALVLLWGAVWFAIWSVGGLIRGIVRLGGKWCYKEAEQ